MPDSELPSNSFLAVLQRKEMQESLLSEASAELSKLALAVKQTKKKGTLSLVLTLEPEKGGAISVGATIGAKAPSTAPQHLTIFFIDKDGALVRDNPEQKELSLTAHDGGAKEEVVDEEKAAEAEG